jgi:hypothetical protein
MSIRNIRSPDTERERRVPPGQKQTEDFPWESRGYHVHGDPWTEERYSKDEKGSGR